MKLLKISRKKSLDSLQQTPTPTEGDLVQPSSIASQSLNSEQVQSDPPETVQQPALKPSLPSIPKKPKVSNPFMSSNENAMRQFMFREVDELERKATQLNQDYI